MLPATETSAPSSQAACPARFTAANVSPGPQRSESNHASSDIGIGASVRPSTALAHSSARFSSRNRFTVHARKCETHKASHDSSTNPRPKICTTSSAFSSPNAPSRYACCKSLRPRNARATRTRSSMVVRPNPNRFSAYDPMLANPNSRSAPLSLISINNAARLRSIVSAAPARHFSCHSTSLSVPTETLIQRLNPVLKGWAQYHKGVVAKQTFNKIDHLIYWRLMRWGKRRHPRKTASWVYRHYWKQCGSRKQFAGLRDDPSGGAERIPAPLYTLADCERFQGKRVTAKLAVMVASSLSGLPERIMRAR